MHNQDSSTMLPSSPQRANLSLIFASHYIKKNSHHQPLTFRQQCHKLEPLFLIERNKSGFPREY